jgi:hypothetical protein
VLIFGLFKALDHKITQLHIKIAHVFFCVLYVALHIPSLMLIVLPFDMELEKWETYCGLSFTVIMTCYYNFQPFHITKIIAKYRKIKKRSSTEPLRRMNAINFLVLVFDWIALMLFLIQQFGFKDTITGQKLIQIAIACVGIHLAFCVLLFQKLRDLFFPKQKATSTDSLSSLSSFRPSKREQVGIQRPKPNHVLSNPGLHSNQQPSNPNIVLEK